MTVSGHDSLRVLVGDDQLHVREALRLLCKGAGHQAQTVDSPGALLAAATEQTPDLILMDLNYARDTTSGQEGLELLAELRSRAVDAPVIVMTAWGSVDLAVNALRGGAVDFVQKPWENRVLLGKIEEQARRASFDREVRERTRRAHQLLFPRHAKSLSTLDFAGISIASGEIGGDYYDFLDLGGSSTGFVIADVSGKGTAGALLMANLQASMRAQDSRSFLRPEEALCQVNRRFYESTPREQYATMFFATYDDSTRTLHYVNCGHLPGLLRRADGRMEPLRPTATVLGLFPEWHAEPASVVLEAGDSLILYTDGVTEAANPGGEELGEIGLLAAWSGCADPETAVRSVMETVKRHTGGPLADDATIVALLAR